MKYKQLVVFAALLLCAALLGWLLPPVVFLAEDRIEEGRLYAMEIKQFDLSYQSDLDTAARLQMIHRASASVATPLEHGIYLQEQDVEEISEQFLRDVTGTPFVISGYCEATPILFTFSGEGTIIVWDVSVFLNEYWTWSAQIDDQTGLILCCSFEGAPLQWDSLFHDFGREADGASYIAGRISAALCDHFQARLSETLSAAIRREESEDHFYIASITLSEDSIPKYTIPVAIILEESMISINN